MIDLGEYWLNEKETAYSHKSDNNYRKALNVRNYMTDMTRKHRDWVPLTTCELEGPNGDEFATGAQGVNLMLVAENGQAGTYCRTDNVNQAVHGSSQNNLSDAFNYIGMMPLEAFVGVYGERGTDPCDTMFTPGSYYANLLSGCSTYYSDVRRWTPAQKQHMRQFNDWRKSPRIDAMLGQVARPLFEGADHSNRGPYAWMYSNDAKTQAMLIAVGFDIAQELQLPLRGLSADKTYLVEDITLGEKEFEYAYRGRFTGRQLLDKGMPLNLKTHGVASLAYWIQEDQGEQAQLL